MPLVNLVHEAVDAEEKIVVWTTFTQNADFLGVQLDEFGAVVVHGGLSMAAREEALDTFKTNPECQVLVATPGAAKRA